MFPVYISAVCACALLLGAGSLGLRSHNHPLALLTKGTHLQTRRVEHEHRISKQKAVAIANGDMLKTHKSLEKFRVVVCEQLTLWLVIYDGGGPEYFIGKWDGAILMVHDIPQGTSLPNEEKVSLRVQRTVTKTAAIQIARRDAVDSYGKQEMRPLTAHACELMNAWRVVFDIKVPRGTPIAKLPNAHPPYYVIDKKTGKILHKQIFN